MRGPCLQLGWVGSAFPGLGIGAAIAAEAARIAMRDHVTLMVAPTPSAAGFWRSQLGGIPAATDDYHVVWRGANLARLAKRGATRPALNSPRPAQVRVIAHISHPSATRDLG